MYQLSTLMFKSSEDFKSFSSIEDSIETISVT